MPNRDSVPADENRSAAAENAEEMESIEASEEFNRLRDDLSAARDQLLRAQAEVENVRKRARRDHDEALRYANAPLLRDLLPVWDNIHRAAEAAGSEQSSAVVEGVRMVAQLLEDVFKRHNCTIIKALGEPFDPHRHEALSMIPTADHPPNTVVQVVQDGFELHDRVIRPAQVIVSTPPQ